MRAFSSDEWNISRVTRLHAQLPLWVRLCASVRYACCRRNSCVNSSCSVTSIVVTVEALKNSLFYHRNTNTTDVPYFPIWTNHSVRDIAVAMLLMHLLHCFSQGGSVLGMDRSQKLGKLRSAVFRVNPKIL